MARLDERTANIERRLDTLVTRDEFRPVRLLVYGAAGAVLMTVIGAALALIVRAT